MEMCIQVIKEWIAKNTLNFNDEKTEYVLIGTKHILSKKLFSIISGTESIKAS